MFPLELLADLPDPRHDEPASLRIDIADELTDHLVCAFRREVLKDGDEAAAQRRTLDRFGDPKQLARRLWWQAMWSRIMKQRIVSALQWSVAVLAMLISGAVFWQQSQMLAEIRQARQEESAQREALVAKLDKLQLPAVPQATDGPVQMPPITLQDPPLTPQPMRDDLAPTYVPNEMHPRRTPMRSMPDDLDAPPTYDPGEVPPSRTSRQAVPDDESDDPGRPIKPDRQVPTYNDSETLYPAGLNPAPTEPAQITVKLVLETKDGAAVLADYVTIEPRKGVVHTGEPRFSMRPVSVTVKNPDGTTAEDTVGALDAARYEFRGIEPDHYELKVRLPDGQYSHRSILIRDDKPQELIVVCPAPRKKATLRVTMPPLPEDLQNSASDVNIWIEPHAITLEGIEWSLPNPLQQEIRFDPKTGRAMELCQTYDEDRARGLPYTSIDLRKSKDEDCVIFVTTGPVGIYYSTTNRKRVAVNEVYEDRVTFPGNSELIPRQITPGENRWDLELPDGFLALARASQKRMDSDQYGSNPPVAPAAAVAPAPRRNGPAQLTVKLVPDSKSGSVSGAGVFLQSAGFSQNGRLAEGSDPPQFEFDSIPADYYELEISLADGQKCTRPLLIEDEKPRELTITCPGPRKRLAMELTIKPLPEKLRELGYNEVEMYVWPGPVEVGQTRWTSSKIPPQKIRFDARTGKLRSIEVGGGQPIDLRNAPEDERRAFLPAGGVGYGFCVRARADRGLQIVWPDNLNANPMEADEGLKHIIKPGEPQWTIELPKEYLDSIERDGQPPPS
jgi:hypothetical protein